MASDSQNETGMDNFSLNDKKIEDFDINISRYDVFLEFIPFYQLFQEMLSWCHYLFYHFRKCYQLLALTQTLRGWSNTALKGFLDNAPSFSWKRKIKWSEFPLLWNTIYFTERISKMVHIRNNWRSHTTQHVLTLQKRAI